MEDGLIERAAREVYEYEAERRFVMSPAWDDADDRHREYYRNAVRIVLTAVREPSEGIRGSGMCYVGEYVFLSDIWKTMIDALLAQGK